MNEHEAEDEDHERTLHHGTKSTNRSELAETAAIYEDLRDRLIRKSRGEFSERFGKSRAWVCIYKWPYFPEGVLVGPRKTFRPFSNKRQFVRSAYQICGGRVHGFVVVFFFFK